MTIQTESDELIEFNLKYAKKRLAKMSQNNKDRPILEAYIKSLQRDIDSKNSKG